jgi:hypothetical protein
MAEGGTRGFDRLNRYVTLFLCVVIDVIGCMTYLVPALGEAFDAIWAPASAGLLHYIFDSTLVTSVQFIEEALPLTDLFPTATAAFFYFHLSEWNTRNRARRQ